MQSKTVNITKIRKLNPEKRQRLLEQITAEYPEEAAASNTAKGRVYQAVDGSGYHFTLQNGLNAILCERAKAGRLRRQDGMIPYAQYVFITRVRRRKTVLIINSEVGIEQALRIARKTPPLLPTITHGAKYEGKFFWDKEAFPIIGAVVDNVPPKIFALIQTVGGMAE